MLNFVSKKNINYKQKTSAHSGQILVEVMIALSITVVSLTGFYGLLKSSLQVVRTTSDNYIATHLAIEGIEIVANIIQTNYINNIQYPGSYSFDSGLPNGQFEIDFNTPTISNANAVIGAPKPLKFDGTYYQYGSGSETLFSRVVTVTPGSDTIHVESNVYVDGKSIADVNDTFYYWWR